MNEDPELQTNDESSDDLVHSSKRKKGESDRSRLLPVMIVILLALIVVGGIYYFVTKRPVEGDTPLQSRIASLEEKIAVLEKEMAGFRAKSAAGGQAPSLVNPVETPSQEIESPEKRAQLPGESKAKAVHPKTAQKRYHTVQKGETLFKISKKYGITVEELSKLNGLSGSQPIRTGQKLLVSARQ